MISPKCFEGKWWLHFVEEKAKVSAVGRLSWFNGGGATLYFSAPDHEAKVTQEWLSEHRPDFIRLGSHVEKFNKLKPKRQNVADCENGCALRANWNDLRDETNRKLLTACTKAEAGYFEYSITP